jgi:outer membrane immunogenic protein
MRFSALAIAIGFGVAPLAGAAHAADAISIPLSTDASITVHEQEGRDWSGFYAGLYGVVQNSPAGGDQVGAGLQAGVNAQFDFYLVGAEVAVSGLAGGVGDTSYGQILGRAGLVATDNVLIYAAGGYGLDLGPPSEQDLLLGGGVELSVNDALSVRAQYLQGIAIEGANPKSQITLGANFHF